MLQELLTIRSMCNALISSQSTKEDRGRIDVCQKGSIAVVTISNEGKRNALTVAMWEALKVSFTRLSADAALRCNA